MKKILIAAIMAMAIVGTTYAEGFWIGATALYNLPTSTNPDAFVSPAMEKENFWFGGDATIEFFKILKAETSILYIPKAGSSTTANLLGTLDAGLSLNILFLNVGLGIGPNLIFPLDGSSGSMVGVNLKPSVGLRFGRLGVNLYGLYISESFATLFQTDFLNSSLLLGLDVQFKLF